MESVHIPTNFTDAGKILGMFPIRNTVEAVALGIPTLMLLLSILPFGLVWNLVGCLIVIVPLCGFAMMGIRDYSLLTFVRVYWNWRRNRKILIYGGETAICPRKNACRI